MIGLAGERIVTLYHNPSICRPEWSFKTNYSLRSVKISKSGIRRNGKLAQFRHPWRNCNHWTVAVKITSDNKFYLLRSLRCRGSSRARPYAPKDRGQSTSGTLVLCFAARRFGHIWWRKTALQNANNDTGVTKRQVKSAFSDIVAPLLFAALHGGALIWCAA